MLSIGQQEIRVMKNLDFYVKKSREVETGKRKKVIESDKSSLLIND